jgi:hypothetical protein
VKTATWPGWDGGYLVATPGLTDFRWASSPQGSDEGVVADIGFIRHSDRLTVCRYLAEMLAVSYAAVGLAMGFIEIYGPHHAEVEWALGRAGQWHSELLDVSAAEAALQAHLARLGVRARASVATSDVVWTLPDSSVVTDEDDHLTAAYATSLETRSRQTEVAFGNLVAPVVLADATRLARRLIHRRTGTAWLWERAVSYFAYDAAWIGIGGDRLDRLSDNPFAPSRVLYRMGVSFFVEPKRLCAFAAE